MGKMKLQMGETLTSTNPKPLAPKIIKCKVMKKKRHPLEMLKIILEGINYNQEMVEDNDSVEDGYTKVEQSKRNRENHSKNGNRVCKLMQINKGNSLLPKPHCLWMKLVEINPTL